MENKKFTAKEIDEEIEKTVQVLDDFPEMLFDRMEAKFPGSQLAQLKAFSRLHDAKLDGVNNPFFNDFEFLNSEQGDWPIKSYKSDMDVLQATDEHFRLVADYIKHYRDDIWKEQQKDRRHPHFHLYKFIHEKRIESDQKNINETIASESVPLTDVYKKARDKCVIWLLKYGVSNAEQISKKSDQFKNYLDSHRSLYMSFKSMVEDKQINMNELCDTVKDWNSKGGFGNDHTLCVFDLSNPDRKILISGKFVDGEFDKIVDGVTYYKRTIQYDEKELSLEEAIKAKRTFEQPCVYTYGDYQKYIENSEGGPLLFRPEYEPGKTEPLRLFFDKDTSVSAYPEQLYDGIRCRDLPVFIISHDSDIKDVIDFDSLCTLIKSPKEIAAEIDDRSASIDRMKDKVDTPVIEKESTPINDLLVKRSRTQTIRLKKKEHDKEYEEER